MGIAQCICGNKCYPDIAIPSAEFMPAGCEKMRYIVHGDAVYTNCVFTYALSRELILPVGKHLVDLLLFYNAEFHMGRYNICIGNCDHHANPMTFHVTNNSIRLGDQIIEPYRAFSLRYNSVVIDDYVCNIYRFVTLSLAMNGRHILY
jgi:hypothetical protein